ncbi:hypothetical protein ACFOOL_16105 [Devosia honganensis]|uniref:Uncharacterized protein n=1 Tax=Devosia honganensis TaxID=1610527 RepID=A0ABV7X6K0_9HYPH
MTNRAPIGCRQRLVAEPRTGLGGSGLHLHRTTFGISENSLWADVYPLATLDLMIKKDAGMRIRVDRQLRAQFVAACQEENRPAAQVLREFMRDHVAKSAKAKNKGKALK